MRCGVDVISAEPHVSPRELGGFRKLLVHRYQETDPALVWQHFRQALQVFPGFAREVLAWMENVRSEPSQTSN